MVMLGRRIGNGMGQSLWTTKLVLRSDSVSDICNDCYIYAATTSWFCPAYTPTSEQSQDPVTLAYVVTLAEHQLSTDLHVTNTSTSTEFPPSPIHFQALLHTYLRAPASSVHISGLNGLYYTDKTQDGTPRQQETRRVVDVLNYTDAVYEDGPRSYEVTWPGGGIHVKAIGFKDIVVWNPSKEAGSKLADMEEGGW